MIELTHPALLAWLVLGVVLFRKLPARRAVLVLFVAGLLLLPEVTAPKANPDAPDPISLPGFRLTKRNAIAYAFLLGSLLLDRDRWRSLRFSPFDLPVAVSCACPLFASLTNDLGPYDGLSESLWQTLIWGVPYLAGRISCADPDGLRDAALAVVMGAALYVPVCWLEVRMSPQLHYWVYGFKPSAESYEQVIRFGGYRPIGLTTHGLVLSLWMCLGAMLAVWLFSAGALEGLRPRLRLNPRLLTALVVLLAVTAVATKSTGAIILGGVGLAVLFLTSRYRLPLLAGALLAVPPAYMVVRAGEFWSGKDAVAWVADHISPERAQSLEFRLQNEDALIRKALERPVFGWGGWGRSRIKDEETGEDTSVTDGLWIILLGTQGVAGLAAVTAIFLLPPLLWFRAHPPHQWARIRPAETAVAVLLPLVMIDNLFNGIGNPVYVLLAGGLTGVLVRERFGSPAPPNIVPSGGARPTFTRPV